MKKALVEVAILVAILGVTASQVKSTGATSHLSRTEKRVEATRLGTTPKAKWTAKRKVAGVPLQANHPNVRAATANPLNLRA